MEASSETNKTTMENASLQNDDGKDKLDVMAIVHNFEKMSTKEVEKSQIPKTQDSKKGKFMSEPPRTIHPDIQSIGGRPRITQATQSPSSILQYPSKNPDGFISNAASRQFARTEPKDGGQIYSLIPSRLHVPSATEHDHGGDTYTKPPRNTSADTVLARERPSVSRISTTSTQTPFPSSKRLLVSNTSTNVTPAVSRQPFETEMSGNQSHQFSSNHSHVSGTAKQAQIVEVKRKKEGGFGPSRNTSADTVLAREIPSVSRISTTSIETSFPSSKRSQVSNTSTNFTSAVSRQPRMSGDQSHQFSSNHSRVSGTAKQAQVVELKRKKEGGLAMEHVTMEGILQSLGLESCLMMFEENDLDYELLRDLSEEKLEKALTDIGLPLGKRLKISGRIQELKYQNTEAKVEALDISKATDAKVKASDSSKDTEAKVEASDSSKVNKASRKRENEEVRLVIIGKTGSGKSATGNTILGEPVFESTISGTSITRNCSQYFVERFGRKIVIVDTPGIFDTKENNEKIQEEIYKCIGITSPGPHAFIFVINAASRYTEEEQRSVEHFVNYFGNEIYKYFIVLFVRKDELDDHKIQLTDHIRKSPPIMQQFIKKCGGRVCAFNNKARGREQDEQVKQLLQKIWENIEQNGGNCYTNEMYKEAEKQIKIKEEERLAKEKAEREQQLQSIKQVIADDYNKKLAQERKNRELVQKNLDELVKKQNKDNNRIADLQSQIGVYEQMIIERRGDQQELKQTLDLMRVELAKSREASVEGERLMEKYKRDMEKSLEEKEKLKRKHEIERQNLQREYEENIAAEREKVRDEIRECMDEEFEEYKRRHIAEMEKRMKEKQSGSSCTIL